MSISGKESKLTISDSGLNIPIEPGPLTHADVSLLHDHMQRLGQLQVTAPALDITSFSDGGNVSIDHGSSYIKVGSPELEQKLDDLKWQLACHQERCFMAVLHKNPTDLDCMGQYADWLEEQIRIPEAERWRYVIRSHSG